MAQQLSPDDETLNNKNINTNQNSRKNRKKSESDSEGEMVRPSFSMHPPNSNKNEQAIDRKQKCTVQIKPSTKCFKRIPDTGFIVYETLAQQPSNNILQVSAAKQGATIKCDTEVCKTDPNKLECVVRVNGTVYGSAPIAVGKKEAKAQAFDTALEHARRIHYTIKVI